LFEFKESETTKREKKVRRKGKHLNSCQRSAKNSHASQT